MHEDELAEWGRISRKYIILNHHLSMNFPEDTLHAYALKYQIRLKEKDPLYLKSLFQAVFHESTIPKSADHPLLLTLKNGLIEYHHILLCKTTRSFCFEKALAAHAIAAILEITEANTGWVSRFWSSYQTYLMWYEKAAQYYCESLGDGYELELQNEEYFRYILGATNSALFSIYLKLGKNEEALKYAQIALNMEQVQILMPVLSNLVAHGLESEIENNWVTVEKLFKKFPDIAELELDYHGKNIAKQSQMGKNLVKKLCALHRSPKWKPDTKIKLD